jgi:hypothetical protein
MQISTSQWKNARDITPASSGTGLATDLTKHLDEDERVCTPYIPLAASRRWRLFHSFRGERCSIAPVPPLIVLIKQIGVNQVNGDGLPTYISSTAGGFQ